MEKLRVWVNFDATKVPLAGLREHFGGDDRFEYIERRITDYEEVMQMAQSCDVLINTFDALGATELERLAKRVKIIVRYGTGYERIDIASATALGIPVANCPGANAPAVAEAALLHILNAGRHFDSSIEGVRRGIWPGAESGSELDGKVIALLGYGNIAQHLSRMLGGFSVSIRAYDPYISERGRAKAAEYRVTIVDSLTELVLDADVLSVHVPLTDGTREVVDADLLALARPGLIVINTSRGPTIDERALLEALDAKRVKAAGLDVLVEDPPSEDNPLLNHPSVSVTPHIGASTYESEMRTQAMIYDTVTSFLSGTFTSNVINKEALASRREYAGY